MGPRFPLKKVAAFAPHAFAFQGPGFRERSSWTSGGTDVPFVRLRNRDVIMDMLRCAMLGRPFGFAGTYRNGVARARNVDEARIKVERSNAELLCAGRHDGMSLRS